jgi:hypothetical protein
MGTHLFPYLYSNTTQPKSKYSNTPKGVLMTITILQIFCRHSRCSFTNTPAQRKKQRSRNSTAP